MLTGFTSLAAEKDTFSVEPVLVQEETPWNFADAVTEIQENAVSETKDAAEEAYRAYQKKIEERRKQPKKLKGLRRKRLHRRLLLRLRKKLRSRQNRHRLPQ